MQTSLVRSFLCAGFLVSCGSTDGGGFGGVTNGLFKKVNGGTVDKLLGSAENIATNAITGAVSGKTNLPAPPKAAAGGVDLSQEKATKTGQVEQDMDGDGQPETVTVTETEATSGPNKYASWSKGDACYVAWQNGDVKWIEIGTCGDTSGSIICHYSDPQAADAVCQACNAAGACQSCDPNNLASCSWSADAGSDGASVSDGAVDGATDPGTDGAGTDGTDFTDPGTDGSGGTDVTDPGTDGSGGTDVTDPGTDGSGGTDVTDPGTTGTGSCSSLWMCTTGCLEDPACLDGCYADASEQAAIDFGAFAECVNTFCGGNPTDCLDCGVEESVCTNGG